MAAATSILSKSHQAKQQASRVNKAFKDLSFLMIANPTTKYTIQSIRVALEKSVMVLSNLWMGSWLHQMEIGFVFPWSGVGINLSMFYLEHAEISIIWRF